MSKTASCDNWNIRTHPERRTAVRCVLGGDAEACRVATRRPVELYSSLEILVHLLEDRAEELRAVVPATKHGSLTWQMSSTSYI